MQTFFDDVFQIDEGVSRKYHTYGHPSTYQVFQSVRQTPFTCEKAHSIGANLTENTCQLNSTVCPLQGRPKNYEQNLLCNSCFSNVLVRVGT